MKSAKLLLAMLAAAAATACSESPGKEGEKDQTPAPAPNPTAVKYVARIDYLLLDKCEAEEKRESVSQKFEYDDQGRVTQIAEDYDLLWKGKGSLLYHLDYNTAGEITVRMTDKNDGGTLLKKIVAELDEKGRFKKSTETTYDDQAHLSGEEICTYNSEGRIGKWHNKYSSMGDGNLDRYDENEFFYDAEGLLTRYTYFDSYDNQGFEDAFPAAEFYPNRIACDKSNLDLMFHALAGSSADLEEPQVLFSLLRLTGGGFGTCLPEKTEGFYDTQEEATPGEASEGWDTPNVTVHQTYTYVESVLQEDEYIPLDFKMDADGCITQIAYEIPYAEYLGEYDIVVGSEVINEEMNQPWFPEEGKRYKYEIKNEKSTKQRDIVNPVTIDIVYR